MILVFGANGQVGTELRKLLPDGVFLAREQADFADSSGLPDLVERFTPDAVINAAAYTAVDKAEDEEELARAINADAPARLAVACRLRGIPLVHISTDYVYDGSGTTPVAPGTPEHPSSAYGRSKLEGDLSVLRSGAISAVLRTSWVFSAHGRNFVKTMLALAGKHGQLRIVSDQVGGPTSAASIAAACVETVRQLTADPGKSGLYHFAGTPDVSWAEFAREIFSQSGLEVEVVDIGTADYPTRAIRPLNSRLDCSSLSELGLKRPDWKADLGDVLKELRVAND